MVSHVRPNTALGVGTEPEWHVIDAGGKTLGRISTEIAVLLQGKHKPTYVPYLNTGDFVIVTNAEKIRVTGEKLQQKIYYHHSGYPGGLKEHTLASILEKDATRAIKHAVKGMLPKSRLGRKMFSRLKVYAGTAHPHEAQVKAGRKAERARTAAKEAAEEIQATAVSAEPKTKTRIKKRTETPQQTDAQNQLAAASETNGELREGTSEDSSGAKTEAKPKPRRRNSGKPTEKPETRSKTKVAMATETETPELTLTTKKPRARTGKPSGSTSETPKRRVRGSSSPKANAGSRAANETSSTDEEA